MSPSFFRKEDGILWFYSVDKYQTFEKIDFWLGIIEGIIGIDQTNIIGVGNKIDLNDKREVSTEQGEYKANSYNLYFSEASALTGINLTEIVTQLLEKIVEKKKDSKEDKSKSIILGNQDYEKEYSLSGDKWTTAF